MTNLAPCPECGAPFEVIPGGKTAYCPACALLGLLMPSGGEEIKQIALPPGRWLAEALTLAEIRRPDMLAILPEFERVLAATPGARCDAGAIWLCEDGSVRFPHKAKAGDVIALDWIREHPAIGSAVGPYSLLELLGEGGFAEVYRVTQVEPVRREAALKILKLGMDSHELLARFAREREALAKLEHSGIARVYDAGNTDAGRPYVVMELVRGLPITGYCDENKLTARGRAELFCCVCRAIGYAHSKGVIHRDIKPSNLLVHEEDSKPKPKVIDFGIAHAASEAFTGQTVYTRTHQFFGTPGYVPPEQFAGGAEPDERADVYALGAVLYELLTGHHPHAETLADAAGIEEILAAVRSPVLQPRVAKRADRPIARAARRALEPRPEDRYQTVNELLEDLQLALAGRRPKIPVASQRRSFAKRALQLTLAAAALFTLAKVTLFGLTLLGFFHKTPISRTPDGSVRPVALYQFDSDLENSIPGSPPLTLHGSPEIQFETATIGDQTAQVLNIPQLAGDQWFSLPNIIGPNGDRGSDQTNHFTFVFDLMVPAIAGRVALYQCNTENFGEAEVFLYSGGLSGRRSGRTLFESGQWYRIAIVSSSVGNAQTHQYYINGQPWGSAVVVAMINGKQALDERIQFFCDNNGDTARLSVNSLAIYDVPLHAHEIRALGPVSAPGIPETATPTTSHHHHSEALTPFAKITAPALAPDSAFGATLAAQGDEIAGGITQGRSSGDGSVALWIREPTTPGAPPQFRHTQTLADPSPQPWEKFGTSLAYHRDTLAIGSPGDRTQGISTGAVHLATKENARWIIRRKTAPSDLAPNSRFGTLIASSDRGLFIATDATETPGTTYYYRSGEWDTPTQKIPPPENCPGLFASSIAANGPWLAIGSPAETASTGNVALYRQTPQGTWNLSQLIRPPDHTTAFGHRLAIDETTLIISGRHLSENSAPSLAAYKLPQDANTPIAAPTTIDLPWTYPASLESITLTPKALIAGSANATTGTTKKGSIAIYQRPTSTPGYPLLHHASARALTANAGFGTTLVTLPATNQHPPCLIVGAPHESSKVINSGAAFAFTLPVTEDQRFPTVHAAAGGIIPAISGDLAAISTCSIDSDSSPGQLTIYQRNRQTHTWSLHRQSQVTTISLYDKGTAIALQGTTGIIKTIPGIMLFDTATNPITLHPLEGLEQVIAGQFTISKDLLVIPTRGGAEFFRRNSQGTWSPFGNPLELAKNYHRSLSFHGTEIITPTTEYGGPLSIIQLDPDHPSGWKRTSEIPPPTDTSAPWFGHALSHKSGLLAIGSPGHHLTAGGHAPEAAAVYLYEKDSTNTWQPTTHLTTPGQDPQSGFGMQVTVADDTTLLVSDPGAPHTRAPGQVHLYKKSKTGHWHHRATLQASNALPGDNFGIKTAATSETAIITGNLPHTYFFDLTQFQD